MSEAAPLAEARDVTTSILRPVVVVEAAVPPGRSVVVVESLVKSAAVTCGYGLSIRQGTEVLADWRTFQTPEPHDFKRVAVAVDADARATLSVDLVPEIELCTVTVERLTLTVEPEPLPMSDHGLLVGSTAWVGLLLLTFFLFIYLGTRESKP